MRTDAPPVDHVVIFDEAQRAWNREKTADFMKRKKGRPASTSRSRSSSSRISDRHDSWAVIICLVGGGQEIHTGEAGIGAWLEAVRRAFPTLADVRLAGPRRVRSTRRTALIDVAGTLAAAGA